MRWVERVNGNGRRFLQWQPTYPDEPKPDWPSAVCPGCPICGETYEYRHLSIAGDWQETKGAYIYHDPQRHRDYLREEAPMALSVPREPGE